MSGKQTAFRAFASAAALACAVLFARDACAQAPLTNPDLDLKTNGAVLAMARQPDGGLVFGGSFTTVDGIPRNNLARLRPDDSLDTEWNPPPNTGVRTLLSGPDGAIYVSSTFLNEDAPNRTGLVRLVGPSGAIDPNWIGVSDAVQAIAKKGDTLYAASSYGSRILKLSMTTGEVDFAWIVYANDVRVMAVNAEGALYFVGRFDDVNGISRDRIAKVSATGKVDPDWSTNLPGGMYDIPTALAIGVDGCLFVGGSLGLLKLSGSTGAPIPLWQIPSGSVNALAIGPTGLTLFAGGSFVQMGGERRINLAQLFSITGQAVSDWDPSPNGPVHSIVADANGRLDIGGSFNRVGGEERAGIATLSQQGAPITPVVETLAPGYVGAHAARPDGTVIVGGSFIRANGLPRSNALRLLADGTLDPTWHPTVPFGTQEIAVDGDESVYLSGVLAWHGDQTFTRIVKVSDAGLIDPGWNSEANDWVDALVVDHQGDVYASGSFTSINGVDRKALAKLSPTTGSPEATWNMSVDCCRIAGLAVGPDDELYVGGDFSQIGGQARHGIARLSRSGVVDSDWYPITNGNVFALALDSHGDVYIGGQFLTIGGQEHWLVAKAASTGTGGVYAGWDAGLFPLSSANYLLYHVWSIAIDSHDTVYLTGYFGVGGLPFDEQSIARFSGGNGLADVDWRPLPGGYRDYVTTIAGDRVYVSGNFTEAGGQPRQGFAAFSTTLPDRLFADNFELRWPQ